MYGFLTSMRASPARVALGQTRSREDEACRESHDCRAAQVSLHRKLQWTQVLTERLLVETARDLDLEAMRIIAQAESEVPPASGRSA